MPRPSHRGQETSERASPTPWATGVVVALLLAACTAPHYVVVREGAPLYRDAVGDDVVATLPRAHHEALDAAADPEHGRVAIRYRGQDGFADLAHVRVFAYLAPVWDGGEARERAVRRELRELELANVGAGWPDEVLSAIRADEVHVGMSRPQVELAWGWPLDVEPGPVAGSERWLYRFRTTITVPRWADDPALRPTWEWGCYPQRAWPGWRGAAYAPLRVPAIEDRWVEFGPAGTVERVRVRRAPVEAPGS